MRPSALLALVPVLALAATAPAHAATFCVADPTCPAGGVAQPSVDAALAAADDPGRVPDTVRVGPGRFPVAGVGRVPPRDTLAGAGAGRTTLVGAFELTAGDSTLRDATVEIAPGRAVGVTARGTVSGVTVVGPAGTAVDAVGSTLIEDSSLAAPIGIDGSAAGVDVRRTRITATTAGVRSPDGGVVLDAVLIDLTGADATGVVVGPGRSTPVPSTLRHVTVRGTGADQTGVAVLAGCGHERAQLSVDATAIAAVGVALRREGSCSGRPSAQAQLTVTRSAYDPTAVVSRGAGAVSVQAPVSDAPDLDASGAPVAGSPLVDAGDPAEPAGTDLRGLTRPADGDGDGTAVADVGAFELQPPAPTGPGTIPAPSGSGGVLGAFDALPSATALTVKAARYAKRRPRRYQVNSVLSFPAGTVPWGGVTTLQVKVGRQVVGKLQTTMDRLGHADFKLRLAKGLKPRRVTVQVFFGGNYTLAPFTSEKVRLR